MAYRYIDPGTGGIVVSSLWGYIVTVLAAIAAFIAYLVKPLRRLLTNIRFLTIVVVVIALIIMVLSVASGMNHEKVILLGIDALDASLVERMIKEGKLPNFQKLEYSRLESSIPPETPVAWSAAATGMNPGKFGLFDFIGRKGYNPVLTLVEEKKGIVGTKYSSGLKGTPIWDMTSAARIPTTVVKWPVTFPAEEIYGRMLSGLGTVDVRGLLNSYSFYTEKNETNREGDTGRIVSVQRKDNVIDTQLYGPLLNGQDMKENMKIWISNEFVTLDFNEKTYRIEKGSWSEWIRLKFRGGILKDVYGIFRVYLINTDPLEMYVTSVQIDPENQLLDITYPSEYGKELADEIGLFYTMGMAEDTKAVEEGKISKEVFLQQINQIETEREKIFWKEFSRLDGLLAFAFDSGDRLQHIFWGQKDVEDYYIRKDKFLGKILERMDDDTKLIVFSDHGFTNFDRTVTINRWLVEQGYMSVKDNGTLLDFVKWNETKAYSLGFSSIYLNLKGREPQGVVEDREIVEEIIGKLKNLTDPKTGKKVIVSAHKREDVYSGKYLEDAPDIIIGFEKGYRMSWQNAIGGITEEIFSDNTDEWKGDHLVDNSRVPGVVFANFEIRKDAKIIDIAPTVLGMFGIESDMDGRNLAVEK